MSTYRGCKRPALWVQRLLARGISARLSYNAQNRQTPQTFPLGPTVEALLAIASAEKGAPAAVANPIPLIAPGTGLIPERPVDRRSHDVKLFELQIDTGMNPDKFVLPVKSREESEAGRVSGGDV